MQVERTNSDAMVVNRLPDGSRVIANRKNEMVFALNATAGAAWDACNNPTTLAAVTESMQISFDPGTTMELAEEAILRLREQNLVKTSGESLPTTRRKFIATLSTLAIPLVVSLPIAEQQAYAAVAASKPPTPTPTPVPKPKN